MPIIVTISRGTMSGGEALAQCLSTKLGYPTISREAIKDASVRYGISEADLVSELTKKPGLFDRLQREKGLYLQAIRSAMVSRARKGGYIYHGNAGHLLLKDLPQVLKVRLIAPIEFRIRMLRKKNKGMTVEEAKEHIAEVDKKRREWTSFLYGVDWHDPSLYDMVLNLETITIEGACALVAGALALPEFEDTPARRQTFDDSALACQVETELALNDRTKGMKFEVSADAAKGVVSVSGQFYSSGMLPRGFKSSKSEIIEAVKAVPGVKEVDLDLRDSSVPIE